MGTERIAGIKLNVDRMTDGELLGAVDHQLERFYSAERDLGKLIGHATMRGLMIEADPADVVSLDDYRQGKLFEEVAELNGPDGAA
jgi:hypothetical protein